MDGMTVVDAGLLKGVVVVVEFLARGDDTQERGVLLDVLGHLLAQRRHRVRAVDLQLELGSGDDLDGNADELALQATVPGRGNTQRGSVRTDLGGGRRI